MALIKSAHSATLCRFCVKNLLHSQHKVQELVSITSYINFIFIRLDLRFKFNLYFNFNLTRSRLFRPVPQLCERTFKSPKIYLLIATTGWFWLINRMKVGLNWVIVEKNVLVTSQLKIIIPRFTYQFGPLYFYFSLLDSDVL